MAQIFELSGLWAWKTKGPWHGYGLWLFPGKGSLQGKLGLESRVSTGCGQMVWGRAWNPEGFLPQASLPGSLEVFGEVRDVIG